MFPVSHAIFQVTREAPPPIVIPVAQAIEGFAYSDFITDWLAPDLILYHRFDEEDATEIADWSGNGNVAQFVGDAGQFEASLVPSLGVSVLVNQDSHIDNIGFIGDLSGHYFSMVFSTGHAERDQDEILATLGDAVGLRLEWVLSRDNRIELDMYINDVFNNTVWSSDPISLSQPVAISHCRASSTITLSLNGDGYVTKSVSSSAIANKLHLGYSPYNTSQAFSGALDEVLMGTADNATTDMQAFVWALGANALGRLIYPRQVLELAADAVNEGDVVFHSSKAWDWDINVANEGDEVFTAASVEPDITASGYEA